MRSDVALQRARIEMLSAGDEDEKGIEVVMERK